eukprot:TRINITY_DN31040_c0_g1_i1.p1 TRINITY_DN31040_c0_g1~~TRINITY_DN31040_c0_g1_i1.p1  ORF type:complete len:599 (-),score=80.02 TRINITY_DN31040_c0_g1_i1:62-1858(-)
MASFPSDDCHRTLFHGGCILTCQPVDTDAVREEPKLDCFEWMLISGDRITQLGVGDPPCDVFNDAKVIDLRKRLVLPGLFDSHCHVFAQGKLQQSLVLQGVDSIEKLQAKLKSFQETHPRLTVIEGNQWDQELLGRFPTKNDLDVVDVPVVIYRRCWHMCCLNSAALKICGVRGGEKVHDGSVDVDEQGEATGLLREGAMDKFLAPLKSSGGADLHKQFLRDGMDLFLKFGCTSVLTNDGLLVGGIPEPWKRYSELEREGKLPIRIFLTIDWKEIDGSASSPMASPDNVNQLAQARPASSEMVSVFRVKLWTDGALGASTAAVEEPYSDDPEASNRGILQIEPPEMRRIIRLAKKAGFGVEAHTIGDRSARELLDAFEETGVQSDDRYTLTHCQILKPELMRRMQKLGSIASIQPQFSTSDAAIAPERLGKGSSRLRSSYAWKTLVELGVRLAGGSDAPVETPSPLLGMYCAMVNDVHSSESLSFARALQMYTIGGAYTARRENDLGALRPGYRADFVITNLLGGKSAAENAERFRTADVDEVWVGGIRRYAADCESGAVPAPVVAPEGPGKRGISFCVRGPCPCCGPRTAAVRRRLF